LEYVTKRKVIDDKLQELRARDSEEAEQIIAEEEIKTAYADGSSASSCAKGRDRIQPPR